MVENSKKEIKEKKSDYGINVEEMAEAGLQFGHKKSSIYPKMKIYIAGIKNTIHIIDLEKSAEEFKKSLRFIEGIISSGKIMLLVGTKVQAKDIIKEIGEECGLPYVNERWLGGTITNFPIIRKRIEYFEDLENKRKTGELEKYTKKERLKIDRELNNFEIKFAGLRNLKSEPGAVFVVDIRKDILAIKEAKKKGLPVIAIADTNVNPELADYIIPANDDAITSLKYILEKVSQAVKEGQKNLKAKKEEKGTEKEEAKEAEEKEKIEK